MGFLMQAEASKLVAENMHGCELCGFVQEKFADSRGCFMIASVSMAASMGKAYISNR